MSNYKGFPICQAKTGHDEIAQRFVNGLQTLNHLTVLIASRTRASCGLGKLQPVIVQRVVLRTLMKDARGDLIR
jgi:hypothetical protein